MEVKQKIVASRGFFPTCDIEATTTSILPNTLQNGFSFTKKSHFSRVVTATTVLTTAETLPKRPLADPKRPLAYQEAVDQKAVLVKLTAITRLHG
jgi:hypothetical protein